VVIPIYQVRAAQKRFYVTPQPICFDEPPLLKRNIEKVIDLRDNTI